MELGGGPQGGVEEEEESAAQCDPTPLPNLKGPIIVLESMQMITTPGGNEIFGESMYWLLAIRIAHKLGIH